MWINKEVNIPEALITAQREGKLVVFAGAGISMGPPSNLPNFEDLAEQVAGGVLDRLDGEPFDRYLGRLDERGVDVQARTRGIIDDPNSEPKPIHHYLVELFGSSSCLRIVTTNFDTHLTTAAHARYSDDTDIYVAPAVPLGREFSGLVYLHGSVKRPECLVLTDSDFGRAYLTDGWATRFLMEMFAAFTVLFIGYSHEDPVMRYLARGFVGRTARFAITPPDNDDHWIHLGITPVHYPKRPAPDHHGALTEAIRDWVEQAKMGILDHERRIEQIVQSPPPLEPDIEDYLKLVIREPVTLRFFVKYAKSPEWLRWADGQSVFEELFTSSDIVDERPRQIAAWFADNFAVKHVQEALNLIQEHGMRFNPVLFNALAWELARHDPRPSADVLAHWALVLTSAMGPGWRSQGLGHILAGCRAPDEADVALLLFSRLARPQVGLKRLRFGADYEAGKPHLAVEATLPGDQYDLQKAWAEFFQPQMDNLYRALRPMLTAFLTDIHQFIKSAGQGNSRWDQLSYSRSAIEPHEQDRHPEAWEFLVDAARDLLEWMLENKFQEAEALIEEWSKAQPPLLRRLAIHGMAESKRLLPDIALEKIEERNWLYDLPLKHEVYRLIAQAFPAASELAQKEFVKYSISETALSAEDPDQRETSEYERYNVAVWLNRIAPESPIARRHFQQLQAAHPDFGPRDNPDLDRWTSEVFWVKPKSPESVDDLVASDPADRIDWLLSYDPKVSSQGAYNREGLLNAVQQATSSSFTWSWQLAEKLAQRDEWESDLWLSILEGWKDDSVTDEQRERILELLDQNPSLDATAGLSIAGLLEHWVDKDEKISPNILDRMEQLSDRLVRSSEYSEAVGADGSSAWLANAINHIGGRIPLLWLKMLSERRAGMGDEWSGLPEEYQARFEEVIYGDGLDAQLARTVLCSQAHFLFNLDPGWTKQHLIPLFDWRRDALRAEQAWSGFLTWGRWNDALFSEMESYVRQAFSRLSKELSDLSESLCNRLAAVAAYSLVDPWHDGWLKDFIREAEPEKRKHWATSFGLNLQSLSPEASSRLWTQWISDYWSERLTGVPQQLTDREKEEMILWAIGLKPEFDAVVEKIVSNPAPSEIDHYVFRRLQESELALSHPRSMGRLLRHLLSSTQSIPYGCDSVFELAKVALKGGAVRDDLLEIADSMGRLGCKSAQELRNYIDEVS